MGAPNNGSFATAANTAATQGTDVARQNSAPAGQNSTSTQLNANNNAATAQSNASQGTAAYAASDNAQLADSQSAQNSARQGAAGSRDNVLSDLSRQRAQFDNAASNSAPDALRGPVYGAANPDPNGQNPANSGPLPGSDRVLGTDGNVYFVRQISPPVSSSFATAGAPRSSTPATSTTGATSPTAATQSSTAAGTSTRVISYGPGGDNVRGELLMYELNGNFRFTHPTRQERMAVARATRQSTK